VLGLNNGTKGDARGIAQFSFGWFYHRSGGRQRVYPTFAFREKRGAESQRSQGSCANPNGLTQFRYGCS
jgi:hypothetical protein